MDIEKSTNEIELREVSALIYIPEQAVEIEMNVKVYIDGEIKSVTKTLNLPQIQQVIEDGKVYVFKEDLDD